MQAAADRIAREPDVAALQARWAAGESPWLASAKIKLVDGCNLRCAMCDYWKGKREGELSTEEVEGCLADLAALGCPKVHLTGGELLLRRDIPRLVAAATERGMRVNLTTNGTRLDKGVLKELLAVPVRGVTISLDAPAAAAHDAIRGREGAWKRSVKALDRLLQRRGPRTRARVNTVVSRRNLGALLGWPAFFQDRPVDGWLLLPLDAPPGDPSRLDAADIAYYDAHVAPRLAEAISIPGFDPWIYGRAPGDAALAARGSFALGYYDARPCHAPWLHVLIGPSGDVYPCCNAHRRIPPLGNVRTKPLQAIFADSPYVRLRRAMLAERLPLCAGCPDFVAENQAIERAIAERSCRGS